MEYRQDDEEVKLMVVSAAVEQFDSPPAKKHRLVQVADKGGANSSSVVKQADTPQTKRRRLVKVVDKGGTNSSFATLSAPSAKLVAEIAAAEEAIAAGVAEVFKPKVPKIKVPFYYVNKTFAVSASRGSIK